MNNNIILQANSIKKNFKRNNKQVLTVLDNIDFHLSSGEIVSILGKSGSGKSTFLRILAGLSQPSSGNVMYHNKKVIEPVNGMAMVFQSFALMPWLTVLQNVELGLEALGIEKKLRRKRALAAIDMIGLDGFESAYPKELSGGMKQRVGFARALVVNPEILIMDEPFSALDVLTAEHLRNDLLNIWHNPQEISFKSIIFVTHNIEEAVAISNRIIIFDSNPGSIKAELIIPRKNNLDLNEQQLDTVVSQVYKAMTSKKPDTIKFWTIDTNTDIPKLNYRLPDAQVSQMIGLIENISLEKNKKYWELADLADNLHLDIDDLFPITEGLELLKLAKITEDSLELTEAGKLLANTDILESKKLFARQLYINIPLAKHIRQTIEESSNKKIHDEIIMKTLLESLSGSEAKRVLKVIIDWGRYAEIFAYDYVSRIFSLENPV